MPLVSMRQLLDHAAENGYGLPAFNVNNMEQVWAIMEAANQLDAPVIMQASPEPANTPASPSCATRSWPPSKPTPHPHRHAPGPRPEPGGVCMAAIKSGFTSVMMDGSLQADGKTVASYEYNVDVSKGGRIRPFRSACPSKAELGVLGSLEP